MRFFTSGSPIVDQIGEMNIVGNMIPKIWYRTIVNEKGKTQYLAITILADIVYWYKPEEVRDERTGMVTGWKKRFRADYLQKTISVLVEEYDENERTILRALAVLEDLGVIKRHRRTIKYKSGIIARNVLYIELIPQKLYELTYPTKEAIEKRVKADPEVIDDEPFEVIEDEIIDNNGVDGTGQLGKSAGNDAESSELTEMPEWTDKKGKVNRQKCKSELTNLSVHSAKNVSPLRQKCQSTSADLSPHFAKNVTTNTENTTEITEENIIYPSIHNTDGIDGADGTAETGNFSIPKPSPEEIRKIYRRLIAKNIDLDFYMNDPSRNNKEMFQQLYETICDIVCVPRESVRINGTEYPYELVKSQFMKLNIMHMEYAIECLNKVGKKSNIRGYQITTLYNAPATINLYYSGAVNTDIYGVE